MAILHSNLSHNRLLLVKTYRVTCVISLTGWAAWQFDTATTCNQCLGTRTWNISWNSSSICTVTTVTVSTASTTRTASTASNASAASTGSIYRAIQVTIVFISSIRTLSIIIDKRPIITSTCFNATSPATFVICLPSFGSNQCSWCRKLFVEISTGTP